MDAKTFFLKSKMVWGLLLLLWPSVAVLIGVGAPDDATVASLKAAGESLLGSLSQIIGTVLAFFGARTPTGKISLKP